MKESQRACRKRSPRHSPRKKKECSLQTLAMRDRLQALETAHQQRDDRAFKENMQLLRTLVMPEEDETKRKSRKRSTKPSRH